MKICCWSGIDFRLFCFMILSSILLLIMLHSLLITILYDTFKSYWLILFILYEWTLWIIFQNDLWFKGLFFWHFFGFPSLKFFGLFNLISFYSLLCIAFLLILYHSKLVYLSYLRNCSQNWNSCIFVIPGIYIYIYIYIIYIYYILYSRTIWEKPRYYEIAFIWFFCANCLQREHSSKSREKHKGNNERSKVEQLAMFYWEIQGKSRVFWI